MSCYQFVKHFLVENAQKNNIFQYNTCISCFEKACGDMRNVTTDSGVSLLSAHQSVVQYNIKDIIQNWSASRAVPLLHSEGLQIFAWCLL